MTFRPKYVTFDCHGTMINYDIAGAVREHYGDMLSPEAIQAFLRDFAGYRRDEVIGAWQPYVDVIHNSLERTCKANNVAFDEAVALDIYNRVPTWGPHADVPAGLAKIAPHIPLVALTNAMNEQIPHSIAKLGAPIHAVVTAEDAGAYKPRMRPFEYMFDVLGCGPADILHVSASFRYDLMTARDLRIENKVWVNRGYEPANPWYGYTEIPDVSHLPGVLGL